MNDGGPAFPVLSYEYKATGDLHPSPTMQSGMTLRKYFFAKVMQGFCANPSVFAPNGMTGWALVNCSEDVLVNYAFIHSRCHD